MEVQLLSNRTKSMNPRRCVTGAVLTYQVTGALEERCTDEQVLSAVLDAAPEVLGEAGLVNAEIADYHGSGVFEVEVNYEELAADTPGRVAFASRRARDEKWYLAVSHNTERTLTAVRTASFGPNAPAVGNLVNWNGKTGNASVVSGADIISTTLRENCVLTLKLREFNTSFRKKIANLTGRLNSRSFHGWAAGEVLFLGGSSGLPYTNDQNETLVDVTLQFAVRRNSPARTVNGRTFSAGGWDVVWPLGSENVFVSSVYFEDDLNILGVG